MLLTYSSHVIFFIKNQCFSLSPLTVTVLDSRKFHNLYSLLGTTVVYDVVFVLKVFVFFVPGLLQLYYDRLATVVLIPFLLRVVQMSQRKYRGRYFSLCMTQSSLLPVLPHSMSLLMSLSRLHFLYDNFS